MGGCCIPLCHNSSAKGYVMKVFPRDPQRRAQWAKNINRKDWTPTYCSYVCEVHFAPEMWESNRRDNKRIKLKHNAVPTIFVENCETSNLEVEQNEIVMTENSDINNVLPTIDEKCELCDILRQQLNDSKRIIKNLESKIRKMRNNSQNINKEFSDKISVLQVGIRKNEKYKIALHKVFTKDQVQALFTKSQRARNWSNETIQRALKLKLACGANGYEEIHHQGIPLPALRTLRRKLQDFKFEPGISDEMFDFLVHKKSYFKNNRDLECGLVFDEMGITPKNNYDSSTSSLIGNITFPNQTGSATHAIVFMLVGIATRWKHIVGYHFTGNSFDSSTLKDVVFEIINRTESVGYYVNFVTSDMGSGNQGMWNKLGITSGRFSKIRNYIIHPYDLDRKLYIIADVPHILKNLKQALVNNQILELPEFIVSKYKLPSNKIELKHFDELIDIQDDSELLLTPRLHIGDLRSNNTFDKMRVNKAKNVFSHDVSCSLQLLADETQKPEFITTAWFVETISKWFNLMTSRSCELALGNKDERKYTNAISFLNDIIEIFRDLKIGNKGQFKPVQKGIMITTKSIINLSEYLINKRNFQFVFTSRYTQDCVENLFSQLRAKNAVPSPLQFKNDLKLISIAMYMRPISHGNYDIDDKEYLSGFLDFLSNDKQKLMMERKVKDKNIINTENVPQYNAESVPKLSNLELNSLYNIAGYLIKSIKTICRTCDQCLKSVASKTALKYSFTKFVNNKCFTNNSLYFVNYKTFKMFLKLERIFRYYSNLFKDMNGADIKSFLVEKFSAVNTNHILNCHNLRIQIFTRFAVFRLKIYNKKSIKTSNIRYDSKTAAMYSI